ncbi:MAG: hypothetical protein IJ302_05840 [Clostridia bacterium]|nr:hypothetical protein [Clostridia bacterium]
MKNLIRRAYITMNTKKAAFAAELKNDERGVSAIVATVLLLLIVVLMAAVFYDTIAEWFSETMGKVLGEGSGDNYSEDPFQPS